MRTYAPVLALCALALIPTLVAQAAPSPVVYKPCDKKPSADDTEAAKGLFAAGKVSYNEADYPKAIQLWKDAFERDCTALLLLQNLANAYEKAGNIAAAITTLETFLARDPQTPEAATIQKRIENMKKALAAATAASSPPSATSSAPPSAPSSSVHPAPTTTATAAPAVRSPLTPLIVAGAGGAFTLVGLLVYAGGYSKLSEAEKLCPDRRNCSDPKVVTKGNEGRSQMLTGGILTGVGLAGVAGGLAWYFLSKPEGGSARGVTPILAPGYAGFSWVGRF
ncbi:MAG: tetratricopeptide repeat protein [Myxococcales bacterium]|nr:tetratricopeptide repeat protein [Polyangiaceae bacterium]MDW8249937.1 tetratricopeptide repeat protein [Myxococcales bacterium]